MANFSEIPWIAEHVKLYQTDPEKARMWDSSLLGGPGPAGGRGPAAPRRALASALRLTRLSRSSTHGLILRLPRPDGLARRARCLRPETTHP